MRRSRTRLAELALALALAISLAAASALLPGGAARAGDDDDDDAKEQQRYRELTTQASWVDLGMIYNNVDGDDYAYGNYTGLVGGDNLYVLGNFDIFRREPWDGDSSLYYRARGLNLGLDSRYADAEVGYQGRFGVSFLFDQLPNYETDTARSFFRGVGSAGLTLSPGWTAGARADIPGAFQTSIRNNERSVGIDWLREKFGGGFSVVLPASLEFQANYTHETKQGTKLTAGMMGLTGGNPRSFLMPEPLDYVTQNFDAGLNYNGERLQLGLTYYGSSFENREGAVLWRNPYTASGNPTSGFQGPPDGILPQCVGVPGCGTGRKGQAPANWFNQIVAAGGYDLPYNTRVTLNTAFSWTTQDDDFLSYTINPTLTALTQSGMPTAGTNLAALPRTSLDGEIFTTIVDFGVSSRPVERLRLDAGYRFEDRDNQTDQNVYNYIRADSEDQDPDPASGHTRINLPYSLTRHEVTFDAGYRLPMRSELRLGYEWDLTERDFQEVKSLMANTFKAGLTSRPTSFFNTRLNYEYTWRTGSTYTGALPFVSGHAPAFIQAEVADASVACAAAGLTNQQCLFENHPLLRKYYLADLRRSALTGNLTYVPHENVSIAFNLNWSTNDYYNSDLGLTRFDLASPGLDLSWAPCERLSTHAFYNYEWSVAKQNGWSFQGFARIPQSTDPTRRWQSDEINRTHTAGFGFDLQILPERLSFGADYLFAESRGSTDVSVSSGLAPVTPYPDNLSLQHNVALHTEYHFNENFSLRLGYLFEYLKTKDWAFDGLTPTSIGCSGTSCVIGTGQVSPRYTANTVSWSLIYKFW